MFICAGNNENFPFATPVGIGLIESAMNLTRLALFNRPDFFIFVGSAGSYGNYKIFDIVESSVASNIELSFLTNSSYTPLDNVIESYKIKDVSCETNKNIVNSSNYISTNFSLVKKFTKLNIELENMEFFSVLKISQEFSIPVHGIFVVTNYCNQDAHKDFVQHHDQAKNVLIDHVYNKYKKLKK